MCYECIVGETQFGCLVFLYSSKLHRRILSGFSTFPHYFHAYHWHHLAILPLTHCFHIPNALQSINFSYLTSPLWFESPSFFSCWLKQVPNSPHGSCCPFSVLSCGSFELYDMRLETWLCGLECLLLLQMFAVWFPASVFHGPQPPVTSSSRISSALLVCINIHTEK